MPDDNSLELECLYLKEALEYSLELAESAISITENSLYKTKTDDKDGYSSRYFLETILFTLDDIKITLKNQINELYSIEFDTKMNEYYQSFKLNKHSTEIIPFYKKDLIDDGYILPDVCISDIFNKKPNNILKLINNDYNSSENHNK